MKIRILLLSLICAAVTLPGASAAEGKAKSADKEETELGGHMDKMSGAFRKLKRQIADATKNEDSLKLVATIKAESAASLCVRETVSLSSKSLLMSAVIGSMTP